MKELTEIQRQLKAPKSRKNSFGNYSFRKAEDILEAVKPIAHAQGCHVTVTDDLVMVGARYYIKATARLTNAAGESVETAAFAQEAETRKGMDASQITGAASSYARKYALCGLLAIDNTKDADALAAEGGAGAPALQRLLAEVEASATREELVGIYESAGELKGDAELVGALNRRMQEIRKNEAGRERG